MHLKNYECVRTPGKELFLVIFFMAINVSMIRFHSSIKFVFAILSLFQSMMVDMCLKIIDFKLKLFMTWYSNKVLFFISLHRSPYAVCAPSVFNLNFV